MFENTLINSIAIVIIFWLASYVVTFLLGLIEKATSKTGTDLDDKIIKAIKLPIRYLAILLGLFYAVQAYDFSFSIKEKEYGFADIFFVLIVLLISFAISRI